MNNASNKKQFLIFLIVFLGLVALICSLPYLFTNYPLLGIDFSDKGWVGSVIGGVMGPFIAIVAAFLTFLAFWIQFDANKQQRNDISVERLENSMQRFIDIYRDIVNNMYLYKSSIKGQPSFHFLFYEFKSIYICVLDIIENENKNKKDFSLDKNVKSDIEYIAFEIFLSGILTKNSGGEKANFKLNKRIISTIKLKTVNTVINGFIEDKTIQDIENKLIENRANYDENHRIEGFPDGRYEKETVQQLYKGNLPRLSSYFNHFYSTLSFLAEKDSEIDNLKKDLYSANLRSATNLSETMFFSQMGVHEIALLIAYYDFCEYYKNVDKTKYDEKEKKIDSYIETLKDQLKNYENVFIWDSDNFRDPDV
ncbi:MAG: hypothetical protein LBQ22_05440 [Bacteroidales bacterium]|jgi:hypothetical protein|nr:hypothetical protein [Bacteroidales bacterium]